MKTIVAHAHSNIALAKYWGKADAARMLPAVPSLSMTLAELTTTTRVTVDHRLAEDVVELDGAPAQGKKRDRVVALLSRVRDRAGASAKARVESQNDFPTAAGLASSASGFAALTLAAARAFGLEDDLSELSAMARMASVSAARSLFGGFVALPARAERAERVAPEDHFPLSMLVALTASGEKAVGSTAGMESTAKTSPYYPAWVEDAPDLYARIRDAVLARDLPAVGEAMEKSALRMHASMFAADPPLIYFRPATLGVVERVRELRASGLDAFFTMDAGPHVKVLCSAEQAPEISGALVEVSGVERVIASGIGGDATLEDAENDSEAEA